MSETTERNPDIIIPAAPGTCIWVAANQWQGLGDVWPPMYRVPVVAWRFDRDRGHMLPVVVGAVLAEDEPFLFQSPDGPVFIGTIKDGWHTEAPTLELAAEAAGFDKAP